MTVRRGPAGLSDGVVTLRTPEERDLPAIGAGINDPDVVQALGPSERSAAGVFELNRARAAARSPTFAICEGDDRCVGLAWLNRSADDETTGYVGYFLLPEARGRGLATRAVRLLCSWAVADPGLARIRLLTGTWNERSQRVAERSGFRQMRVLRDSAVIDGRRIDQVLFELPR